MALQAKPKRGPNCVVSVLVIDKGSPASLLVYKAIALEGGVHWAAYQRASQAVKERVRVAVNFSYFWFR